MSDRILGPTGSKRRRRFLYVPIALAATALILLVGSAAAHNIQGFGIDADHATPTDALFSGNNAADDWAQGTSQQGMFALSAGTPHTAATDCYGSNVDFNTAATGVSSFICDGNSDTKFKATEPEKNIVSPSGKTPDPSWPIKPGNVRPKNDFSHAYVHARVGDSPCDGSGDNDDTILYLGGNVGDNEGDHFWGFEFDKNTPTHFDQLTSNSGDSFSLDFNRSIGDILVSFTVPGSAGSPVVVEVYKVTAIDPVSHKATFTLATAQQGCPTGGSDVPNLGQGWTLMTTNEDHDVTAPPWNVPACDPTADNSQNQCRLASSENANEDLLAPRDFAEAAVDLTAFGINPCFSNVIFTSRSAHVVDGADIQDVGGATFPLCGKKTGVKFHDLNANGVKDSSDPGLNGWTMNLYKDAGTIGTLDAADDSDPITAGIQPFSTATTATVNSVAGVYSFENLSGKYIVCEKAQRTTPATTGWNQSLPSATSTPPTGETTANCSADSSLGAFGYSFTAGTTDRTGNDFGNFRNGSVTGVKFKDRDADGAAKETGEGGLNGWTINLYKADATTGDLLDGDPNTAGIQPVLVSTTTTATLNSVDGVYSFTTAPGRYVVCEIADKTGWVESYPGASTTDSTGCSAVTGAAARGWKVTIVSEGTGPTGRDFGNTPLSHITVGFFSEAKLPNGTTDATHATSISCVDAAQQSVGSSSTNSLTSDSVKTSQSSLVCTITFVDP